MPVIRHNSVSRVETAPGVIARPVVRAEVGAVSLTVSRITITPGHKIPLHTHPTEEAIMITEGSLESTLGSQVQTLEAGHTVLAPAGVPHRLENKTNRPARIIAIFPTVNVQRNVLE